MSVRKADRQARQAAASIVFPLPPRAPSVYRTGDHPARVFPKKTKKGQNVAVPRHYMHVSPERLADGSFLLDKRGETGMGVVYRASTRRYSYRTVTLMALAPADGAEGGSESGPPASARRFRFILSSLSPIRAKLSGVPSFRTNSRPSRRNSPRERPRSLPAWPGRSNPICPRRAPRSPLWVPPQ